MNVTKTKIGDGSRTIAYKSSNSKVILRSRDTVKYIMATDKDFPRGDRFPTMKLLSKGNKFNVLETKYYPKRSMRSYQYNTFYTGRNTLTGLLIDSKERKIYQRLLQIWNELGYFCANENEDYLIEVTTKIRVSVLPSSIKKILLKLLKYYISMIRLLDSRCL